MIQSEPEQTVENKRKNQSVMNKLIPGALFSSKVAEEQRIRMVRRGEKPAGEPDEIRKYSTSLERAAEGFRKNDPKGIKAAELLRKMRHH